jgi:hypothetical protein
VLLLEELIRYGVEVVFLRNPPGHGPEENLLLQVCPASPENRMSRRLGYN